MSFTTFITYPRFFCFGLALRICSLISSLSNESIHNCARDRSLLLVLADGHDKERCHYRWEWEREWRWGWEGEGKGKGEVASFFGTGIDNQDWLMQFS